MPSGFLEHYYGTNLDQPCAVAEAIRQHWQCFTFAEARHRFNHRPQAKKAEDLYRAFGMNDGAVFYSGKGEENSTLVLCTSGSAAEIMEGIEPLLAAAAWKIHNLLNGHPDLLPISRTLVELSPKQLEVLRVQIENPKLSFDQQAKLMGVSRRMLEKRHRQIAERFGVSSFASAVTIAVKQ